MLPNTLVYATRAVFENDGRRRPIRTSTDDTANEAVIFDEEGNRHRSDGVRRRELYPLFRGTLEPDVTFLGFDLTRAQAVGAADPTSGDDGAGWFFILQGPPTEPRFGLDETVKFENKEGEKKIIGRTHLELQSDDSNKQEPWSDVAWGDLVEDRESAELNRNALGALTHAPAGGRLEGLSMSKPPDVSPIEWGYNAAHMAFITLNLPVRIAIHADDMLPEV